MTVGQILASMLFWTLAGRFEVIPSGCRLLWSLCLVQYRSMMARIARWKADRARRRFIRKVGYPPEEYVARRQAVEPWWRPDEAN